MRRQIIVVFSILFLLAAPRAFATERGALFKVSGGGHTMYLFGTMHVGLPEFFPLEPRIAKAVAGASTLALEIDPEHALAAAGSMVVHGLCAPGETACARMPPELRARLERAQRRAGLDPVDLAVLRPWLQATMLALAECSAQGYSTELAADNWLAKQARAGKAKVMELESVEAQFALFDRLSVAEQWSFLEDSIAMSETGRQGSELREMVDAWSHADRATLDAIALRGETDTTLSGRFMQQVLLDERNGPMADKLMQLLAREDGSVAAVGVLHLVGKRSVPALLRARGVSVERVY